MNNIHGHAIQSMPVVGPLLQYLRTQAQYDSQERLLAPKGEQRKPPRDNKSTLDSRLLYLGLATNCINDVGTPHYGGSQKDFGGYGLSRCSSDEGRLHVDHNPRQCSVSGVPDGPQCARALGRLRLSLSLTHSLHSRGLRASIILGEVSIVLAFGLNVLIPSFLYIYPAGLTADSFSRTSAMGLALLSLAATTLISTAAANGNFLVNLTDTYYPTNGCAVSAALAPFTPSLDEEAAD